MAGLSVEQYRCELEAQVEGDAVRKAIDALRGRDSVFRKYSAIEDLLNLGQRGEQNYEDKDAVLAILLAELKRATTLFPLLNLMFWKSLIRLFYSKRRRVPDEDEDDLFVRIQTEFFHVAASYPLDRRPRKIDVNLFYDVMKKVTRWQREEALIREQHEEWDPAQEEYLEPHEERPTLADLQITEVFPEEMEAYLLDLVYRKVINERQYDLLLETQVYRRMTQKAWAEAHGVSYATVRSWHRRAEISIRNFEKARRKREHEDE